MECFFNGQPLKEDFLPFLTNTSLIGYMRDIYLGRGDYNTSYMMLATLIEYGRMDLFDYIFERFFHMEGHPYGSYKDIKYFCGYIKESELPNKRDLYHHIIRKFVKPQLEKDVISDTPSLLAKWLPREKSKFGWLAKEIAWCCYDEGYDLVSHTMKHYRTDIANINRRLDTAQIHMSEGQWNITELRGETLRLQYRSFMNHCPESIAKRERYFNQALMTPQYLVKFYLEKKDPLYNYCWEDISKTYEKSNYLVAVDCVEGIGFALASARSHVYTGSKMIAVNKGMTFNEDVREIYHALASLKGMDDYFILFTNKEYDTKYDDLKMIHWNVTAPSEFPRQSNQATLISGNDPLMLKCFLKGDLTFEAMLKDSRYN